MTEPTRLFIPFTQRKSGTGEGGVRHRGKPPPPPRKETDGNGGSFLIVSAILPKRILYDFLIHLKFIEGYWM